MRVGWVRIGDFRPISRRIYIRCEIRQRLLLITNRKSNTHFQLVPKSTTLVDPELTLDDNYALHYISEPNTKICMKIDPYYQRQKCSPGIVVSSKVSYMWIFAGVR